MIRFLRIYILPGILFLAKGMLFMYMLMIALRATADTYYIISRHGNDANTGRTKENAWQSCNNLGKNKFSPGDSILFANASSYRGGLRNIHVFNNTVIRTREPNVDRYIFWTGAQKG